MILRLPRQPMMTSRFYDEVMPFVRWTWLSAYFLALGRCTGFRWGGGRRVAAQGGAGAGDAAPAYLRAVMLLPERELYPRDISADIYTEWVVSPGNSVSSPLRPGHFLASRAPFSNYLKTAIQADSHRSCKRTREFALGRNQFLEQNFEASVSRICTAQHDYQALKRARVGNHNNGVRRPEDDGVGRAAAWRRLGGADEILRGYV
ncbi:hypothetical protein FB451DRAFT_1479774 [Mycena latifolia]|nr:hypothetical protein FB451DRAFT_1479774 [Mycena latifolia]